MAGYINPADLILPYLQPLIGSVNTGIEQGLKFGALQQAINKEKMLEPYYQAHSALYNAQAAEKAANEKRVAAALARLGSGGGGGMALPEGGVNPQWLMDYITAGGKNPELLLPSINPVEGAGGVQIISKGTGASRFKPTPGLPPAQKVENIISGDTTQSVLVDRSGATSPVMLPGTPPANTIPEGLLSPDAFTFGGDIPGPTEGTKPTAAIPGPRFAPKETWDEPYPGPGGSLLQKTPAGRVASILGREPKGAGEDEIAKSANLSAMRKLITGRMYASLPAAERETLKKLIDPFSGTISSDQVFASLPEDQQKHWNRVGILAAQYAKTMSPEEAVDKAWEESGVAKSIIEYRNKNERADKAKNAELVIAAPRTDAAEKEAAADIFNQNSETDEYVWKPNAWLPGGDWEKQPKRKKAEVPAAKPVPAAAKPPVPSSTPGPSGMTKTSVKTTTKVGGNTYVDALIEEANNAIRAGADPEKVKQRLKEKGITVK